jgi:hypothetical protein
MAEHLLVWVNRFCNWKILTCSCRFYAPTNRDKLSVSRYHSSRNFALYDGEDFVAMTVYRKGAEAIRERLEADAQVIANLQRQIAAEHMPAYRVTAPRRPAPR